MAEKLTRLACRLDVSFGATNVLSDGLAKSSTTLSSGLAF